mgnify:CR=1 FL=1
MSDYKIETKCIQSGYQPGNGEPRVLPIYQSTTFKYDSSDQMGRLFDLEESGYFYTRLQNPTNDAVAAKICDLEGGVAAMLTSSGQAASFYAIMNIVEAGDHIVCASALYGGTYNLYAHTIKKMGIWHLRYLCGSRLHGRRTGQRVSREYQGGIRRDHCKSGIGRAGF